MQTEVICTIWIFDPYAYTCATHTEVATVCVFHFVLFLDYSAAPKPLSLKVCCRSKAISWAVSPPQEFRALPSLLILGL